MSDESLRGIDSVSDEKVKEIEDRLNAISRDEPYLDPGPSSEEKTEPAPEAKAEEAQSQVTEEAAESKEPESNDEPTLPDNHIRSLIGAGWTKEEIDEQHSALGDEFLTIAEKVHENRLRESREWAAHGRIEANQRAAAAEKLVEKQEQGQTPSELERVDIDALKREFGNDPRINAMIDSLGGSTNRAIEALQAMMPKIAESQARQEQSEQAALQNEVNSFFNSPDLLAYKDLYGVGPTQSIHDEGHWDARMKVLEVADQIRVGASYQGREVGLSDALSLAHESVSADFRVRAVREDIKSKMQQRQSSITQRPSTQQSNETAEKPPSEGGSREMSRKELEDKAQAALRQIFG
jgi:hypothetical protein